MRLHHSLLLCNYRQRAAAVKSVQSAEQIEGFIDRINSWRELMLMQPQPVETAFRK